MLEYLVQDTDRFIAKYIRKHTVANDIWDEGQLGALEGVLGTVDQLVIDRCVMEEVKQYQRNLAVAFYDYKKAYDRVHRVHSKTSNTTD